MTNGRIILLTTATTCLSSVILEDSHPPHGPSAPRGPREQQSGEGGVVHMLRVSTSPEAVDNVLWTAAASALASPGPTQSCRWPRPGPTTPSHQSSRTDGRQAVTGAPVPTSRSEDEVTKSRKESFIKKQKQPNNKKLNSPQQDLKTEV